VCVLFIDSDSVCYSHKQHLSLRGTRSEARG